MNIYPYVYKGVNSITGEFYIGMRCANETRPDEDLMQYRTSSKIVKPRFHEFDWTILAEFFTKEAAYDFEQDAINANWGNPLMLNRSCYFNRARFSMAGTQMSSETKSKISSSLTGRVLTAEHKKNIAECQIGKTINPEQRAKMSIAGKGKLKSDSHKLAISSALRGVPKSDDHKRKLSESRKASNALRKSLTVGLMVPVNN